MKTKDEIAKEEIIFQAQKIFKHYGFKKTTMDEISEACGKAKSTLYHYFKNKEQIFDEVIRVEINDLRIIVKQKVEIQKTISDKLSTYFLEFHKEIINKVNLYTIVNSELKNGTKSVEVFHQLLGFETGYVTRILEDAYESGEFTEISTNDIAWFTETLLAGFFGIVKYSIQSEASLEVEKMERAVSILIPKLFG